MRKRRSLWSAALACFLCAVCIVPFAAVFVSSLRSARGGFTLQYYYQVFVGQSRFLFRFLSGLREAPNPLVQYALA